MYEPPSLAHQGVDFDNPAAVGGQAALRPSVGLIGYQGQAFNADASLSLFSDDAALYRSLKRTRQQSIVAVVILGALLVLVSVLYYTKDGSVTLPDEAQAKMAEFNNRTDLIDLDLDANNNHGACMSRADQAYLLFMNGILVAHGSDNCGLELVDKQLQAPECRQNMHGQEMWVAIEAQDSEAVDSIGTSLGGIKASMEWCGLEITTNGNWQCSTTAEPGWQNPSAPGPGDERATWAMSSLDPFSVTWNEDDEGNDLWGEPAIVLDSTKVEQQADGPIQSLGSGPEYTGSPLEAQWIWMGGKSVAGHKNTESTDSVYCRRKVSCHDPEFSEQIHHTGYRCESAFVNQTEVQEEAVGCEHEVEKDEGEEAECIVGLMASPENFLKGVGGCMLMIYMFVGFHIVCDDFFVPALNVLCDKLNMPDDIAGATFMAAGASSPELFASLIGVLTHSAVGAGTVVGSELFNMLVIIGGVCLVTPTALTLDWRPLAREVLFFALSLVGILLTLNDSVVYLYEACLLMGGYALYVIVCANFNKLVRLMCPVSSAEDEAISSEGSEDLKGFALEDGLTEADIRESVKYSADQLNGKAFGMDYGQVLMHGFMFKKSEFYTKVRNSKQMWQKRWLVLNEEVGLFYTKKNGKDRVLLSLPASWAGTSVEKLSYTEFALKTPGNTLVFKAAKPAFCKAWIRVIEARIQHFKTLSPGSTAIAPTDGEDVEDFSKLQTLCYACYHYHCCVSPSETHRIALLPRR
eukprot:COSAG02_NODE_680_length_18551_cov_16.648060_15_plen_748_part_00